MDSKGQAGFRLDKAEGVWVNNINISGDFNAGMELSNISNSTISNCRITGPKHPSDVLQEFIESISNASVPDGIKVPASKAAVGMRFAKSRESFLENYNLLISSVADHMAVFEPILRAIEPLIKAIKAMAG